MDLLKSNAREAEDEFYSRLESSQWLSWIKSLLQASVRIGDLLDLEGASVVCHCSGNT